MKVSQFDLDNKTMKDLIVICNNNIQWNSISHMIERALQLCHQINTFCAINQRSTKRLRDDSAKDNDRSVRQDILTPGN